MLGAGHLPVDHEALDHCERIPLHQHPIFESPRFGLVAVGDHVLRLTGCLADSVPFDTYGERRASSTAQARGLQLLDDRIRAHLPGLREDLETSSFEICVQG